MSDWSDFNRNPFEGLDQLAARLGVEPISAAHFGVTIYAPSGNGYDFFALANAFLDKMQEALKP